MTLLRLAHRICTSLPPWACWSMAAGMVAAAVLLWLYPDRVVDGCTAVGLLTGGTAAAVAVRRRSEPAVVSAADVVAEAEAQVGAASDQALPLRPSELTELGDEVADRWRDQ